MEPSVEVDMNNFYGVFDEDDAIFMHLTYINAVISNLNGDLEDVSFINPLTEDVLNQIDGWDLIDYSTEIFRYNSNGDPVSADNFNADDVCVTYDFNVSHNGSIHNINVIHCCKKYDGETYTPWASLEDALNNWVISDN